MEWSYPMVKIAYHCPTTRASNTINNNNTKNMPFSCYLIEKSKSVHNSYFFTSTKKGDLVSGKMEKAKKEWKKKEHTQSIRHFTTIKCEFSQHIKKHWIKSKAHKKRTRNFFDKLSNYGKTSNAWIIIETITVKVIIMKA